MTTAVEEKTSRSGLGVGDSWKVIVLNDNHNSFQGVAEALTSVLPGYTYDKGMQKAMEIHQKGLAVVWSGMREPAELYWQMLADSGLSMAPLEC